MDEWEWLASLASHLGEPAPEREEVGTILRASRQVARGVERKLAPLSAYVAGQHVARRTAEGARRDQALREVQDAVNGMVPEGAGTVQEPGTGGRGGGVHRRGRFRRFGRRRMR